MIRIYDNRNEECIRVKGHASEYHTETGNVVCAAVSALTCNLINSLKEFCGADIWNLNIGKVEPGNFWFSYRVKDEKAMLLIDSWMLGMKAIAETYHCIEFCDDYDTH